MTSTIVYGLVGVLLIIFLFHEEAVKILTARKNVQLEIEKQHTEQKRLEFETTKLKSGVFDTTDV